MEKLKSKSIKLKVDIDKGDLKKLKSVKIK
jgi:hypothetical protein